MRKTSSRKKNIYTAGGLRVFGAHPVAAIQLDSRLIIAGCPGNRIPVVFIYR